MADQAAYVQLLRDLGYLVDEPADFTIETTDVDEEVAVQAGPQLVVPVLNARFAANAANARWGSLYDALYGTDALPEDDGQERGSSYNPKRGAAVIARARAFLDEHFPLEARQPRRRHRLLAPRAVCSPSSSVTSTAGLADPAQYVGHRGDPADPEGVLLVHHGLHVEIQVDRSDPIGEHGRGRREGPAPRGRGLDDHGPRGLGRRGRRRGQGRGLPQLAPAQPGHAHRRGHQGRRRRSSAGSRRTGSTTGPAARSCCPVARCSSCARSAT